MDQSSSVARESTVETLVQQDGKLTVSGSTSTRDRYSEAFALEERP